MTDRSAFNEKPGRLDDQVGEDGDYAAEYRDNVQSISGSLKGVARFGIDPLGSLHEVEVPAKLRTHRYIEPMVAAINSVESGITPTGAARYRRVFQHLLKVAGDEADLIGGFSGEYF
mgnify:CR=1 FL=1